MVITGIGAVTPLGTGMVPTWERLVAGRSALGPITALDPSGFPSRLGGQVGELPTKDHMPKAYRKAIKVMARDTEIAVVAARLAVDDARLSTRFHADTSQAAPTYPADRFACQIGAGLIAADTAELAAAMATAVDPAAPPQTRDRTGGFSLRAWGTEDGGGGGMNNLPPLWMLKYLPNMLACHVSIIHGCEGPSNTHTCGEASGLLSLGESARVIERGNADAAIAGGAESKLNLTGLLRLCGAGHLAPTDGHSTGSDVIRPFDPASPGTLMSEGGALLVLEGQDAANARGARVYATLAGFGAAQSSSAALHRGSGTDASAKALASAIRSALRDAALTSADIDAVVPQGCGVPAFDRAEADALAEVFGLRLASLPAVTLTPFMGNLYAGHASVQAAVAAWCLHTQTLPARLHAGTPAKVRAEQVASAPASLRAVLVTCQSIAGQCAAMVVTRPE
ncbi:MAG: 3-oxoacyl-ACP synthase [Phycisphaerae bacterium]|nr:MAG: 3-oxoacyl-ACP synthase [Phycisphaerae bacterium]